VDEGVVSALLAHLPRQQAAGAPASLGVDEARAVVGALHCLQRLAAAPQVAMHIVGTSGGSGRIFAALLSRHDHVATEAARLLLRLFAPAAARSGAAPWGGDATAPAPANSAEERAAARAAKSVCFISDSRCAALVAPLRAARAPSPLLTGAVAEAAAAAACGPGAATTEPQTREALLLEVASLGRPLFSLFAHPAPRVADAAALLMRAVAEGGAAAAAPMREAALVEGAVLHHLLGALGPPSARARLSRELVALWSDRHEPAMALLRRVFPPGLLRFLDQRRRASAPAEQPTRAERAAEGGGQVGQPPGHLIAPAARPAGGGGGGGMEHATTPPEVAVASRSDPLQQQAGPELEPAGVAAPPPALAPPPAPRLRSPLAAGPLLRGNWEALWAAVLRDHSTAGLIWNERTRSELRDALQVRPALCRRPLGGAQRWCRGAPTAHASTAASSMPCTDATVPPLPPPPTPPQAEEGALRLGRQRVADAAGGGAPAWNAEEFVVSYPSLASHLAVGGVYVRLLLEGADAGAVEALPHPKDFFTAAHLHFLRLGDASLAAGPSGGGGPGGSDADAARELCVRAMGATYAAHAAEIGPFAEGLPHMLAILDATPSRPLRLQLMRLIEALLAPRGATTAAAADGADDAADTADAEAAAAPTARRGKTGAEAAHRAAVDAAVRANAAALVQAGGVELLVAVVAAAHEASERPAAALQTHLLAAASHSEEVKLWFYYPAAPAPPAAADGPPAGSAAAGGAGRRGPVSKAEIRQLYARAEVTLATPFWVEGMAEPAPLRAVRELRWWVARGAAPLAPFAAAAVALRALRALAAAHAAVDARGEAVVPLPAAHRQLASPRCLPHLAQVVLTGEPALVAGGCALLLAVLRHNEEAMAGLYRTGVFFFLLAYCGSNLGEAARLLGAAHLRQAFRGAGEAAPPGRPLAERSFLGGLLPGERARVQGAAPAGRGCGCGLGAPRVSARAALLERRCGRSRASERPAAPPRLPPAPAQSLCSTSWRATAPTPSPPPWAPSATPRSSSGRAACGGSASCRRCAPKALAMGAAACPSLPPTCPPAPSLASIFIPQL
jgi:DnaJ family protein C protein 13